MENLEQNGEITVIHCDGIGRIVVMICRDALPREHLHRVLEYLKATLLIIPSFSTGNYDFEDRLQICRSYDCCAVWINTCSVHLIDESVGEKLNKIGMVLRTGKGKLKNRTFDCLRSTQKCDGLGDKECTGCLYVKKLNFLRQGA